MDQIPNCIPATIPAGTTVKFRREFGKYPASAGWTYKIYLNGPATLNKAGTADADGFLVTIAATDTAPLAAGFYQYVERVTSEDESEVYDVGHGGLNITPNLATAAAGATQTPEARTLEVINAAILGRMTADMESYSIAGRSVTRIPIADLTRLRGVYAAIVAQQQAALNPNGSSFGRQIKVEFTKPGINDGTPSIDLDNFYVTRAGQR